MAKRNATTIDEEQSKKAKVVVDEHDDEFYSPSKIEKKEKNEEPTEQDDTDRLLEENGYKRACFKEDEQRIRAIREMLNKTGARESMQLEDACSRLEGYVRAIDSDDSISQVYRFGPILAPRMLS